MNPTVDYAAMRREEALSNARKRVKEMKGFYLSAAAYVVVIPSLWILNLVIGGNIWAHWPMIGWGIGQIGRAHV